MRATCLRCRSVVWRRYVGSSCSRWEDFGDDVGVLRSVYKLRFIISALSSQSFFNVLGMLNFVAIGHKMQHAKQHVLQYPDTPFYN